MTKFKYSTKVKALANRPLMQLDNAIPAFYDEPVLNPAEEGCIPAGRKSFDCPKLKNGLSRPNQTYKVATFNCRTLNPLASQAELDKLLNGYTIHITCIQEHRFVHSDTDPDIVARDLGSTTLFTSSAIRNNCGASIHGVGIVINSKLIPLLDTVKKMDERIVVATFKGNPKTTFIACYSPHNGLPDDIVTDFYSKLSSVVEDVPLHSMLFIGGDMNAQIDRGFSFHTASNRNGLLLLDFIEQHNLVIGNISFQKSLNKVWTFRSPAGALSQIDFVIYRKRWRNSVSDCQAFSTYNPVGSDHRMVTATVKFNLRRLSSPAARKLFWQALTNDKALATRIDNTVSTRFNNLSAADQDYASFVSIATKAGTELLPPKPRQPTKTVDIDPVVSARKATLRASTRNIQSAQKNLRKTFDRYEDMRINNILRSFETPAAASVIKNAWDLVKKLSAKKTRSVIFIEGDDRLKTWENHFKNLLSADPVTQSDGDPIVKIFDLFTSIQRGDLTEEEVDLAVRQLKNGKAPGLDGLPSEFWKLPKVKKSLLKFCIETFHGNRPKECGISGLTPIPKKGDLRNTGNYRLTFSSSNQDLQPLPSKQNPSSHRRGATTNPEWISTRPVNHSAYTCSSTHCGGTEEP